LLYQLSCSRAENFIVSPANPSGRLALAVVMPAFNEQASVGHVVEEWMVALEALAVPFALLALDDGSRDRTLEVLDALRPRFTGRLIVSTHANRGHGQTCLEGYRRAWSMGARHVLQIDSDGQCDPRYLGELWARREQSLVVHGVRTRRDDGAARVIVSRALRLLLKVRFGLDCPDANVPYRLMRTAAVIDAVHAIPATVDLANIALSVLLASNPACTHAFVPIGFRRRSGGSAGVSWRGFAPKAVALHRDLARLLDGAARNPGARAGLPHRGAEALAPHGVQALGHRGAEAPPRHGAEGLPRHCGGPSSDRDNRDPACP
jgi:dolichol-phosphate mannosyltransferase